MCNYHSGKSGRSSQNLFDIPIVIDESSDTVNLGTEYLTANVVNVIGTFLTDKGPQSSANELDTLNYLRLLLEEMEITLVQ